MRLGSLFVVSLCVVAENVQQTDRLTDYKTYKQTFAAHAHQG